MSDEVKQGTRSQGYGSGGGLGRDDKRDGAGAIDPDNDPLAELIRIVKQEDPFADILGEVKQRQRSGAPAAADEPSAPRAETAQHHTSQGPVHSDEQEPDEMQASGLNLRPSREPAHDEPPRNPRAEEMQQGHGRPEQAPQAPPREASFLRESRAQPQAEPALPPARRATPEQTQQLPRQDASSESGTTTPRHAQQDHAQDPRTHRPPLDPVNLERALRELRESPELKQDHGESGNAEPAIREDSWSDDTPVDDEPALHHPGQPVYDEDPYAQDHSSAEDASLDDDLRAMRPAEEDFRLGPADGRPGAYYDDPDTDLPAAVGGVASEEHRVDAEHHAGSQPRRRRGTYFAVGMLLGFAVLGGVFAVAYKGVVGGGSSDSEPPVIAADSTPAKLPPENTSEAKATSGGSESTVFDRFSGGASDREARIVPREEKIITLPPRKNNERIPGQEAADGAGQDPQTGTPPSASGSTTLAARSPQDARQISELAPVPKRVKTVVVRPDGTLVRSAVEREPDSGTSPGGPPTRQESENSGQPESQSGIPVPALRPRPPETQVAAIPQQASAPAERQPEPQQAVRPQPQQSAPPQPQPQQSASAAPAASPAPAPATASDSFVVQLAARRSEAQALAAYDDLKQQYSALSRYQPMIQRADLGDRGVYYRVRVGPLRSQSDAAQLCDSLKAAGLSDCLVRPR